MGFDQFFKPQSGIHQGASGAAKPAPNGASERAAFGFGASHQGNLIPMGAQLASNPGFEGLTSFGATPQPVLDKELATLEALRRSQQALQQKSERFQTSSPEAQYLFAMAETQLNDDISQREESLKNVFAVNFDPKPSKARSLI